MAVWVTLLRVVTSIAQIGMILSPGPDIINVHKHKSTGEMAALPLVAMIVNNHLWMLYGYLTDSIFPLMTTQLFGELAAFVFTAVYYRWATDRPALNKLLAWGLLAYAVTTLYVVLGITRVTNQSDDEVGKTLGYVGVVINIWMYASPLGTVRLVLRTQSAASLPINLSVMMFFTTALWVAISIIDGDMLIMSLNIAGFILSIIQISLYVRFRPGQPEIIQEDEFEVSDKQIAIIVSPKGETMGVWVTLLRVATTIAQCGMILSPGPDIIKVYKNKSTGEMAALPLVAMVVNNYLWTVYAYLTNSIFPLLVTQLFGEVASIVFTAVYYRWSVDRRGLNRLLGGGLAFSLVFTVYVILGVSSATNQSNDQVGTTLGYLGLAVNLWMYASPLGTIRHVIKTKSAASLPINISVMMIFNTTLWVALAVVDDDMIIMSLNITGIFLSITQIIVYMRYRPTKSITTQESSSFADKQISVVVTPKDNIDAAMSPVYVSSASPIEK
ncbi:MtN3-like protein [Phytophthora megakarya]|uniref:Sugar transporter SWEET1 n=1 Tax=Phytophthora megakarya TaxID=4795 RepID=A0A225VJS2_9STRA|nr:MtN3-like protein [Phytophthora megakarya]